MSAWHGTARSQPLPHPSFFRRCPAEEPKPQAAATQATCVDAPITPRQESARRSSVWCFCPIPTPGKSSSPEIPIERKPTALESSTPRTSFEWNVGSRPAGPTRSASSDRALFDRQLFWIPSLQRTARSRAHRARAAGSPRAIGRSISPAVRDSGVQPSGGRRPEATARQGIRVRSPDRCHGELGPIHRRMRRELLGEFFGRHGVGGAAFPVRHELTFPDATFAMTGRYRNA